MRELPLDVLACPACKGALVAEAAALVCRKCDVRFARSAESADLAPESMRRLADAADPAWRRWREAITGLDEWRARRRSKPQRAHAQPETAAERAMRELFVRAALHGVVVDIGAKNGSKVELMPTGVRYVGVEPFPGENPSLPADAVVVRGFAEALPIADGVADAVVSLASFDYFVDPAPALAEIARALRPDGTFVILISVVMPVVARARGDDSLATRLWSAFASVRDVGPIGASELVVATIRNRRRPNTHYYTRDEFMTVLATRFEVTSTREAKQRLSTILYVVARKRAS